MNYLLSKLGIQPSAHSDSDFDYLDCETDADEKRTT